jgi:pimeloyl-ACP methyl ester carboxylesterase
MLAKKLRYVFIAIISLILLSYASLGIFPWIISCLHHDYPGPTQLSNIQNDKQTADWLLIHGADSDARLWIEVLKANKQISMVALSLSHHEQGVQFADPGTEAAREINNYLKKHKPRLGVIGHSTGGLWIADAYLQCPTCWTGLKVILLAPNTANNIPPQYVQLAANFNLLKLIFPNPYWDFTLVAACQGPSVNAEQYAKCKKTFLGSRLFLLRSMAYYQKLFSYMDYCREKHNGKVSKKIHCFLPNYSRDTPS